MIVKCNECVLTAAPFTVPLEVNDSYQSATISKSSFRAPHSGQVQFMGTASQGVPAAMPCSGSPAASSYIQPQIKHIQVRGSVT